jgi:hypothetical protein
MKIRLVGAELFREDRQTDGRTGMTKQIVAFRNVHNNDYNKNLVLATPSTHLQQTNTDVSYLFQIKLGTFIAVQSCKQYMYKPGSCEWYIWQTRHLWLLVT